MRRICGLWRELRLDGNPLRRACDRTEVVFLACLLSAFVLIVPLAAVIVGVQAYGAGLQAERAERTAWRQVPGVLLVTAPAPGYAEHELTPWVDASGQPTGVPLEPAQVTRHAIGAAAIAATAAVSALLCIGVLGRWVLLRRRLAAWDAEWQAVGPRWTSPR